MAALPDAAFGVFVPAIGRHAYVANWDAGLQVIDVFNPANPRQVGAYNTPDWARGVFVSGRYAYVADGNAGLLVIDVSDPANSRLVGHYDTSSGAVDVYVSDRRLEVANRLAVVQE